MKDKGSKKTQESRLSAMDGAIRGMQKTLEQLATHTRPTGAWIAKTIGEEGEFKLLCESGSKNFDAAAMQAVTDIALSLGGMLDRLGLKGCKILRENNINARRLGASKYIPRQPDTLGVGEVEQAGTGVAFQEQVAIGDAKYYSSVAEMIQQIAGWVAAALQDAATSPYTSKLFLSVFSKLSPQLVDYVAENIVGRTQGIVNSRTKVHLATRQADGSLALLSTTRNSIDLTVQGELVKFFDQLVKLTKGQAQEASIEFSYRDSTGAVGKQAFSISTPSDLGFTSWGEVTTASALHWLRSQGMNLENQGFSVLGVKGAGHVEMTNTGTKWIAEWVATPGTEEYAEIPTSTSSDSEVMAFLNAPDKLLVRFTEGQTPYLVTDVDASKIADFQIEANRRVSFTLCNPSFEDATMTAAMQQIAPHVQPQVQEARARFAGLWSRIQHAHLVAYRHGRYSVDEMAARLNELPGVHHTSGGLSTAGYTISVFFSADESKGVDITFATHKSRGENAPFFVVRARPGTHVPTALSTALVFDGRYPVTLEGRQLPPTFTTEAQRTRWGFDEATRAIKALHALDAVGPGGWSSTQWAWQTGPWSQHMGEFRATYVAFVSQLDYLVNHPSKQQGAPRYRFDPESVSFGPNAQQIIVPYSVDYPAVPGVWDGATLDAVAVIDLFTGEAAIYLGAVGGTVLASGTAVSPADIRASFDPQRLGRVEGFASVLAADLYKAQDNNGGEYRAQWVPDFLDPRLPPPVAGNLILALHLQIMTPSGAVDMVYSAELSRAPLIDSQIIIRRYDTTIGAWIDTGSTEYRQAAGVLQRYAQAYVSLASNGYTVIDRTTVCDSIDPDGNTILGNDGNAIIRILVIKDIYDDQIAVIRRDHHGYECDVAIAGSSGALSSMTLRSTDIFLLTKQITNFQRCVSMVTQRFIPSGTNPYWSAHISITACTLGINPAGCRTGIVGGLMRLERSNTLLMDLDGNVHVSTFEMDIPFVFELLNERIGIGEIIPPGIVEAGWIDEKGTLFGARLRKTIDKIAETPNNPYILIPGSIVLTRPSVQNGRAQIAFDALQIADSGEPISVITFSLSSGTYAAAMADCGFSIVSLRVGNGEGVRSSPVEVVQGRQNEGRWTELDQISTRLTTLAEFSTLLYSKDQNGEIEVKPCRLRVVNNDKNYPNEPPPDWSVDMIALVIKDSSVTPNTTLWTIRFDSLSTTAVFSYHGDKIKQWTFFDQNVPSTSLYYFINNILVLPP
ncbi:MAG: hypothetical protein JW839_13375 [Candidatus Lokiarchaeota archaeon]|nr:hypothetical protein [Candidatus Lokiarchaeota archaeon]